MSISESFKQKYNLLTILGPTAGGKTNFASHIAFLFDAEIISADSRQVYKKMDIGTGKDLSDYIIDEKQIPFHLINIAEPGEKYNLFRFQQDFFKAYEQISKKNKLAIMCGGTGLYIDAVVNNYNLVQVPENKSLRQNLEQKSMEELTKILSSMKKLHNTTEIDTKKRLIRALEIEYFLKNNPEQKSNFPKIKSLNIGIKFDRQSQKKRITQRLKSRLENGMIDEIKSLIDAGIPTETLIYYGLEYKFVTLYLLNKINYEEMFDKLNIAIHQFSKRQMTWFRRMEKKGQKIWWIDGYMTLNEKIERLNNIISKD